MNDRTKMTGRLIAAGRTLAGVSQRDLARAAGLDLQTLRKLEAAGSAWLTSEADIAAVEQGLTHFGIVTIDESDGYGAGVRLKFTRSDAKQIARLEGEGGIVGSDDVP